MPITTIIDPPLPSDSPEVFDAKAFAAWTSLAALGGEINASSAEITTKVSQAAGSATAAANSANAADASKTAADASKTAAAASASTASTKAGEADASKTAAAASATTASNAATAADASKTAAAGSATTATTKAGEAAASATTASGAATTATTKAGEASNSATTASAAATTATTKAGEASASATTASNAATTATTKASEASNSATTATTKAGEASASASAAEQAKLDAQAAAQQAAGGGEPTIIAGNTGQYWRGDKTWQTLNSAAVGLGNVNNTSDASKPISTAQQTALDGKAAASHTHADATTSASGFMSDADKTKLNGVASGATANATDAQLRDRATHTGSQAISTVTGLQTALDGKAADSAALTDAAGTATLPATTAEPVASRLQVLRNNIKQAFADLAGKAADSDVVKLTGAQTVAGGKTFSDRSVHAGAYTPSAQPTHSATPTFDCATSNVFEPAALTGNVTSITLSNAVAGQTVQIRFQQDATGGRTVAAPSGAKVDGSINTTANRVSWLILTYSARGSRWEGNWLQVPL